MDAAVPDAHADSSTLKASDLDSNKLLLKGKQPIYYLQSVSKKFNIPGNSRANQQDLIN